jgi:hypothetical protein
MGRNTDIARMLGQKKDNNTKSCFLKMEISFCLAAVIYVYFNLKVIGRKPETNKLNRAFVRIA